MAIVDLGCAKNTVDSESLLGRLLFHGFTFAAHAADADLLLVNTCGFILSAKRESVEHLLEAVSLKKLHPRLKVVAMGCLAQRYGKDLAREIPELDGIFGFEAYRDLTALCRKVLNGRRVLCMGAGHVAPLDAAPRLLLTGEAYAYLRIADGCDNRCAYCAVPLIRGRFRSRPRAAVLREAESLVARGVKELCLIAQDITYYGADRWGESRLPDLLQGLLKIPGNTWIRLLYAHPAHMSDEVIDLLAGEERLLGYLDLPIQHINTRILRRMGRKVTRRKIERLLKTLRRRVPKLTLRTSVIAGFPGETEREFRELLRFIGEGWFQHLGAFAYSKEEDTPAARASGQIPPAECKLRASEIMAVQQGVTFRWLDSRLGNREEVLVEEISPKGGGLGRTRCEAPEVDGIITLSQGKYRPGERILACLERRDLYDLTAYVVEG
ncbi:MAG: 30S ribosomal protein S12 methylthiotransferase RimO [Planctomycetota bacterium]